MVFLRIFLFILLVQIFIVQVVLKIKNENRSVVENSKALSQFESKQNNGIRKKRFIGIFTGAVKVFKAGVKIYKGVKKVIKGTKQIIRGVRTIRSAIKKGKSFINTAKNAFNSAKKITNRVVDIFNKGKRVVSTFKKKANKVIGTVKKVFNGIASVFGFGGNDNSEIQEQLEENAAQLQANHEAIQEVGQQVDLLRDDMNQKFEAVSNQIDEVKGQVEQVSDQVQEVKEQLIETTNQLRSDISDVKDTVETGFTNVQYQMEENKEELKSDIGNVKDTVIAGIKSVKGDISQTRKMLLADGSKTRYQMKKGFNRMENQMKHNTEKILESNVKTQNLVRTESKETRKLITDSTKQILNANAETQGIILAESEKMHAHLGKSTSEIRHDIKDLGNKMEEKLDGVRYEMRKNTDLITNRISDLDKNMNENFNVVNRKMDENTNKVLTSIINLDKEMTEKMDVVNENIQKSATAIQSDIRDLKMDMFKEFNKLTEVINGVSDQVERVSSELKEVSQQIKESTDLIRGDIQNLNKEMLSEFNRLHDVLQELHASDKISSINTFMEYYYQQIEKRPLSKSDRIMDLERRGGILDIVRDATRPNGDLHSNLYHILNQNLANPKHYEEVTSYKILNVLYLGVQAYVSIMFYLQEQHSFLAHYYYFDCGKVSEFNMYVRYMKDDFDKFKITLLGAMEKQGLITQVILLMQEIIGIPQVRANYNIRGQLAEQLEGLKDSESMIKNARVAFLDEDPPMINSKLKFRLNPILNTPLGEWKDKREVMYAIQYLRNHTFSKIGPWSRPYEVNRYACPELTLQRSKKGTARLIFRKFDNDRPQLVGILKNFEQTKFRDIDRDLFNTASDHNEITSIRDCEILIKNGANFETTFEIGRMSLHAAAEAGNLEFLRNCSISEQITDFNVKDGNGFTPLHIAAGKDDDEFLQLLLERNVNVGLKINSNGMTALHIAASQAFENNVELLLKNSSNEINEPDKNGFAPLHSAVYGSFGTLNTINILLSYKNIDVNVESSAGLTPLHIAVTEDHPDIVKVLLNHPDIDVNKKSIGSITALHFAAMSENLIILKILLESNNIDKNACDMNGWTPLHYAVANGDESMFEELLDTAFININPKANDGTTPLHLAANNTIILQKLLLRGADKNAQTEDGTTALHIAVNIGNIETVEILISFGADMELKTEFEFEDENGQNFINWLYMETDSVEDDMLHVENCITEQSIIYNDLTVLLLAAASKTCKSNILSLLISKGANTKAKTNNDQSFEMLAAQHGSIDSVKYIADTLQRKYIRDKKLNNLLHFAVKGHNMEVIQFLIEEMGININDQNRKGDTPLHIASMNGNLRIIKYLLFKNASLTVVSDSQSTPLHYAASCASMQTISYLVNNGADIKFKNLYLQLPLHKAALSGNFDVAKFFISEKGLDYSLSDINDRNCLLSAVLWSNTEFVAFLVRTNPSIKSQNLGSQFDNVIRIATQRANIDIIKLLEPNCNDGIQENLLHLASQQCFFDLIYYCLHRKADINKGNANMTTPLHFVVKYCYGGLVKYFFKNKANINVIDNTGQTPLHYATSFKNIQILLQNGANIHAQDRSKNTPVFRAAERGDLESVKLLYAEGANINAKNTNGITPLHLAVQNNHTEVVSYLIKQNADVNVVDFKLNNALHYAATYSSNIKIVELLVEADIAVNNKNMDKETPVSLTQSVYMAKYLLEEGGAQPDIQTYRDEKVNLKYIVKALKY